MSNLFVFRPGGAAVPGQNVFNNWLSLINAMSQAEGRKILEFDDSSGRVEIPAGTWPMKDVAWAGFGPRPGTPRTTVDILDGARFTDLRMIGGQITVVNKAISPSPSPVSDFSPNRDHVQIGLRDDGGNPQIVNQGSVAMFDLGANSAVFFVQNSLFGMPTPGIPSTFPLIRHTGPTSVLTINLLGQNQTGPNVVMSDAGATVLFGVLSDAAQIADQQDLGKISFGPVGRIQRHVLPPADSPAAISSQGQSDGLTKPNVLIRCDGSGGGFRQVLPQIRGGFTIGNSSIALYSGGQEVIVAEVVGGQNLTVGPSPGDTIAGYGSHFGFGIDAHGSMTFVSDGFRNWIITSIVGVKGSLQPPQSP